MRIHFGRLSTESPVNLADCSLSGEVTIGAFTYCNYGCEINDAEIGRYCSIGQRVIISPGEHPIDFLSPHPFSSDPSGVSAGMTESEDYARIACTEVSQDSRHKGAARIGHDVWIGARATILRGAEIGHGAIVAAGAVVTKRIEPYAIAGGVPAAFLRWRFSAELRARLLDLKWWNYDLAALGDQRDYSLTEAIVDRLVALRAAGALRPFEPKIVVQEAHLAGSDSSSIR